MEERVAPSLRKTALQILSEKTKIMSSIKSLFAVFFSLSKTPFLKPNTNIQHKNNLINVESTYLVQPIVNAKKLQLHFTDTSQATGFHWKDHNCVPSNFYFQCYFFLFLSETILLSLKSLSLEKQNVKQRKNFWRNSHWTPQIICKPQVFTEKTTIVCHQFFIGSAFFLSLFL